MQRSMPRLWTVSAQRDVQRSPRSICRMPPKLRDGFRRAPRPPSCSLSSSSAGRCASRSSRCSTTTRRRLLLRISICSTISNSSHGWRRTVMTPRERRIVWCALAMLCAGSVAAADSDAPDLGFLEYLGGLVHEDEDWVGPDDMTVAPADERAVATDSGDESDGVMEEFQ